MKKKRVIIREIHESDAFYRHDSVIGMTGDFIIESAHNEDKEWKIGNFYPDPEYVKECMNVLNMSLQDLISLNLKINLGFYGVIVEDLREEEDNERISSQIHSEKL